MTKTDSTPGPPGGVAKNPDAAAIRRWLVSYLVAELGVDPDEIEPSAPFDDLGLDSAAAVTLTGDLEDWLGRPLSPELAYEHPTIAALAAHLAERS